MLPKIQALRERIDALGLDVTLEVDGGIASETIARAAAAGADTFVAGTAVFGAADYAEAIRTLRQLAG
jgi:ribulose-phosphate 3-epimerase